MRAVEGSLCVEVQVRSHAIVDRKRSQPKSHHYVPASYLKRFTDATGFLHIRDRIRCQTRMERPQNVMKIGGCYRQTWAAQGVDPNIFEVELGKGLESEAEELLISSSCPRSRLTTMTQRRY
jgi:hypothetical protein